MSSGWPRIVGRGGPGAGAAGGPARCMRWRLVGQQPELAERLDAVGEFVDVDRLADVAVGAQGVAVDEVPSLGEVRMTTGCSRVRSPLRIRCRTAGPWPADAGARAPTGCAAA